MRKKYGQGVRLFFIFESSYLKAAHKTYVVLEPIMDDSLQASVFRKSSRIPMIGSGGKGGDSPSDPF